MPQYVPLYLFSHIVIISGLIITGVYKIGFSKIQYKVKICIFVVFYAGVIWYYISNIWMVLLTSDINLWDFYCDIKTLITIISYIVKYMLIILTYHVMVFNALIYTNKASNYKKISGFIKLVRLNPLFYLKSLPQIVISIIRHYWRCFSYDYIYNILLWFTTIVCIFVCRSIYIYIFPYDTSNYSFGDESVMLLTTYPIVCVLSVFIKQYLPKKSNINIDNTYEKLSTFNKVISTITIPKLAVLLVCYFLSTRYITPCMVSILWGCLYWLEELIGVLIKQYIPCVIKQIVIKSPIGHTSFSRLRWVYIGCNIKNTYIHKTPQRFINFGRVLEVRATTLYKSNSFGIKPSYPGLDINMWKNTCLFGIEILDKFKHCFKIDKQLHYMLKNNSVNRVMLDIVPTEDGLIRSSILLYKSQNGKYVRASDLTDIFNNLKNSTIRGLSHYPQNMLNKIYKCVNDNNNNNNNNIFGYIDDNNQFKFVVSLTNSESINLASNCIISLSEPITTYLTSVQSDSLLLRTNISLPKVTNNEIINLTHNNNSYSGADFDQLYMNQIVQNRDSNTDVFMMPTHLAPAYATAPGFSLNNVPRTENIANYELNCYDIPNIVITGLDEFCHENYSSILRLYCAILYHDINRVPLLYSRRKSFINFIFGVAHPFKLDIIKGCLLDIFNAKLRFYNHTWHSVSASFKYIENWKLNASSQHELDVLLNCVQNNDYKLLPNTFNRSILSNELGVIELFPNAKQELINNIISAKTRVMLKFLKKNPINNADSNNDPNLDVRLGDTLYTKGGGINYDPNLQGGEAHISYPDQHSYVDYSTLPYEGHNNLTGSSYSIAGPSNLVDNSNLVTGTDDLQREAYISDSDLYNNLDDSNLPNKGRSYLTDDSNSVAGPSNLSYNSNLVTGTNNILVSTDDLRGDPNYFFENITKDKTTVIESWLYNHLRSIHNKYTNISDASLKKELEGVPLSSFKNENTDALVYLDFCEITIETNKDAFYIYLDDLRCNHSSLLINNTYPWNISIHNLVNTDTTSVVDINRLIPNNISYLTVFGALSKALSNTNDLDQLATNLVEFKPSNLQRIFNTFKFCWGKTNPPVELSGWGVIMHCVVSMANVLGCIQDAYDDIKRTQQLFIVGDVWNNSSFIGSDVENLWPEMYYLIGNIAEKYGDDDFKDYFNTRFNTDRYGLWKIALTFENYQNNLIASYSSNNTIQDKLYKEIDAKFPNELIYRAGEYYKNTHNASTELIKMRLITN